MGVRYLLSRLKGDNIESVLVELLRTDSVSLRVGFVCMCVFDYISDT